MDFEVKRADVRECRVVDEEPASLAPGQALLRVDAFALTANNITYAVIGEALRYWDFFPSSQAFQWRIIRWSWIRTLLLAASFSLSFAAVCSGVVPG